MSKWSRWNSVRKAWATRRDMRRRYHQYRQALAAHFNSAVEPHLKEVGDHAMLFRRRTIEELFR